MINSKRIRLLIVFLACVSTSTLVNAQMRTPNAPGSNSPSAQDQSDGAVTEFDGFTVKVTRLVKDPSTEGALRLILTVTDNSDEQRQVALVKPATTLTDDMGNRYQVVDASGIAICTHSQIWDVDLDGCLRYQKADTTKLTPKLPTTLVLYLTPSEVNFTKELAEIASTVNLQSRLGYYSTDFSASDQADIIINGIQIPQ